MPLIICSTYFSPMMFTMHDISNNVFEVIIFNTFFSAFTTIGMCVYTDMKNKYCGTIFRSYFFLHYHSVFCLAISLSVMFTSNDIISIDLKIFRSNILNDLFYISLKSEPLIFQNWMLLTTKTIIHCQCQLNIPRNFMQKSGYNITNIISFTFN